MKFAIVVLACMVAAAHAQFGRASAFAGFNNKQYNNYKPFSNTPFKSQSYYKPQPSVTVEPQYAPVPAPGPVYAKNYNGDASSANIVKSGNEINPDGSFNYYFETDNGIAAQAQGTPRNFGGNPPVVPDVIQGSYSYTSPEGQPIVITYIADENGYQPQGDSIPTAPPVPAQIARALEYIARSAPRK